MRTRTIARSFAAAAATTALLVLPTAALASTIGAADFALTCTPATVEVGDTVSCDGKGLDPNTPYKVTAKNASSVTIMAAAATTATGSGTTDADGEFAFSLEATGEGDIEVTIEGTRNGAAFSQTEDVDVDVVADADADGDGVADTGADAGVLGMVALGAIVIGGGALFSRVVSVTARLPDQRSGASLLDAD